MAGVHGEQEMQIEQMVREVQQALGIEVDGKAGPQTWAAVHRRIVKAAAPTKTTPTKDASTKSTSATSPPAVTADERTSDRSEKVIATLLPQVRPYARALFFKARENGIRIEILSGLRTWAEQDALYAKGRTAPGPKVTNARAGYSNHNFGIAFDIGVFEGSRYLPDSPKYKAVGVLGSELGLEWGGNWKSLVDQPHFQLRPGWAGDLAERDMLAHLRERHGAGKDAYA